MSFQIWVWMVFWSPTFSGSTIFDEADSSSTLFFLSLVANAATLAFFFTFCRYVNPLYRFTWLPIASCAFMSVGCLLLSADQPGFGTLAGSVATGIGSATMMVLWGENLSRVKTRQVLLCCVLSSIIGGLISIVVTWLPRMGGRGIAIALPIVSAAFFVAVKRYLGQSEKPVINVRPPIKLPVRIVVTSVFFGCCFGLMRGLFSSEYFVSHHPDTVMNMLAFVAAGLIVLVTAVIFKLDFRRLTYQIALPLMALGFIFLTVSGMQGWAMPVHNLGFQHFYIILWTLWAYLGIRKDIPASWMFACGMLFLQIGQIVGSLLGHLFTSQWPSHEALSTLSLLTLFSILIMALFFLGSKDFQMGFSLIKPGIEQQNPCEYGQADLLLCCTAIGRTNGLSDREIEVLSLLAQRYNRPQICELLVISDETVKTHIKHIYQKLSIHTREDLIDRVNRELELVKSDDFLDSI